MNALREKQTLPEILTPSASVADIRREPSHTSELVTQAIMGDWLKPIEHGDEWFRVELRCGYTGWVRSWSLVARTRVDVDRFDRRAKHRVLKNVTQVLSSSDVGAQPIGDLVAGTPVQVTATPKRAWREICMPNGKNGFVKANAITRIARPGVASRDEVVSTGMRFVGIPYIWGGTTPKGFDCSGLVQRVFRLHGIELPRDSVDQSEVGRVKPITQLECLHAGDLLFFGEPDEPITHVAIYLSDGMYLHAHGQVRVSSLVASHPLFEPQIVAWWRICRDPFE